MNAVQKGPDAFGELQEDSSMTVRANIVPAIELGNLDEICRIAKGGYVHCELLSATDLIDLKDTSNRGFVSKSFETGLYLAHDLVETDIETIFTDKMLDYYCIELQRFFPMLDRDASPVMEIKGIIVQKVHIPPPPSEETYRRNGTFYYRGSATIFGYSFDVEKYRSTFEEEGEETEIFDMAKFRSAFQENREAEKISRGEVLEHFQCEAWEN